MNKEVPDLRQGFAALCGLPDPVLNEISTHLEVQNYPPGAVVFKEGDPGDKLYLVVEGRAEVVVQTKAGPVVLATLGKGDIFGEIALLTPGARRTAAVHCVTALRTMVVAAEVFQALVDRFPQAKEHMQESMRRLLAFNFLRLATPFSSIAPVHLHALADSIGSLVLPQGNEIVRQGEPGDSCYLVRSGRVEVVQRDADSERRLATLGPGALFGEAALLTEGPRNATVRSLEPVELLVLRRADLLEAIHSDRQVGARMAELLGLRDRPTQVEDISVHQWAAADGETITILKDSRRGAYYRLSPQGWFIWQRLDGRHNLKDLTLDYLEEFKVFAPYVIAENVMQLVAAGFASGSAAKAQAHLMPEDLNWWQRTALMAQRLLQWHVIVRNVDGWFTRVYQGGLRFLYTRAAQAVIAAVVVGGLALFVDETFRLPAVAGGAAISGAMLWWLVPAILLSFVLHEAGHGFTTKSFGREVLGIGLGWYWFGPIMYVDTSDMWLAERWPRIAVSLAGGYTNLFLAGVAAAVAWRTTNPIWARGCWMFAMVSYVLVLFNLNPLLEYDGYFVLCDLLDRPNLRSHCLGWLGAGLPRAWHDPAELRRHALELSYGLGSLLYVAVVAILTLGEYRLLAQELVGRLLPPAMGVVLGVATAAGVIWMCTLGVIADLRAAAAKARVALG